MSSLDLLVVLAAGLVVPILVGVATKLEAADGWKRVTAFAASAAAGFLTAWTAGPHGFDWRTAGVNTLITFGSAVAAYHGVWGKNPPLKAATAGFGLGAAPAPPAPPAPTVTFPSGGRFTIDPTDAARAALAGFRPPPPPPPPAQPEASHQMHPDTA